MDLRCNSPYVVIPVDNQAAAAEAWFWQSSYLTLFTHFSVMMNHLVMPWYTTESLLAYFTEDAPDNTRRTTDIGNAKATAHCNRPTTAAPNNTGTPTATPRKARAHRDVDQSWMAVQRAKAAHVKHSVQRPTKPGATGSYFFQSSDDPHSDDESNQEVDEVIAEPPQQKTIDDRIRKHADTSGEDFDQVLAEHLSAMANALPWPKLNSKSMKFPSREVMVFTKHTTLEQVRTLETSATAASDNSQASHKGQLHLEESQWYSTNEAHTLLDMFTVWLEHAFDNGLDPAGDAFAAFCPFMRDHQRQDGICQRLSTSGASNDPFWDTTAWHRLQPDVQQLLKTRYGEVAERRPPLDFTRWIGYGLPAKRRTCRDDPSSSSDWDSDSEQSDHQEQEDTITGPSSESYQVGRGKGKGLSKGKIMWQT